MDTRQSGVARLALGHLIAVGGTAVLAAVLYILLLGGVDPYAGHTNEGTAQAGAMLAVILYGLFVAGLIGIRRLLRLHMVPMAVSVYAWAVLAGPPVLILAALGLGSTY